MAARDELDFIFGLTQALAFWAVYFHGLRPILRTDNFRERLFELRQRLFDGMVERGGDFTDESYRSTRDAINGTIRMAETLTPTLLFPLLIGKSYEPKMPAESSNPRIRGLVQKAREEYTWILARHLFSTPFGVMVALVLMGRAIVLRRKRPFDAVQNNKAVHRILAEAEFTGRFDDERMALC